MWLHCSNIWPGSDQKPRPALQISGRAKYVKPILNAALSVILSTYDASELVEYRGSSLRLKCCVSHFRDVPFDGGYLEEASPLACWPTGTAAPCWLSYRVRFLDGI